ncbi:hypothetical protein PR202_ga22564 [Eleusine coracana subsp. coracana]|uniref:Uncharacterized protein n=1 Tax=Eleusine coracana subsp. coracana TaxID=191504 RepID=A0AAV5D233_ELECO|nr:hypothetical protein PR202_ga22564 [Eleusine coracana subsp. coracana]
MAKREVKGSSSKEKNKNGSFESKKNKKGAPQPEIKLEDEMLMYRKRLTKVLPEHPLNAAKDDNSKCYSSDEEKKIIINDDKVPVMSSKDRSSKKVSRNKKLSFVSQDDELDMREPQNMKESTLEESVKDKRRRINPVAATIEKKLFLFFREEEAEWVRKTHSFAVRELSSVAHRSVVVGGAPRQRRLSYRSSSQGAAASSGQCDMAAFSGWFPRGGEATMAVMAMNVEAAQLLPAGLDDGVDETAVSRRQACSTHV